MAGSISDCHGIPEVMVMSQLENVRTGRIGTDRNLPEGSTEVPLQYHAAPCNTKIHLSLPELFRGSSMFKMCCQQGK